MVVWFIVSCDLLIPLLYWPASSITLHGLGTRTRKLIHLIICVDISVYMWEISQSKCILYNNSFIGTYDFYRLFVWDYMHHAHELELEQLTVTDSFTGESKANNYVEQWSTRTSQQSQFLGRYASLCDILWRGSHRFFQLSVSHRVRTLRPISCLKSYGQQIVEMFTCTNPNRNRESACVFPTWGCFESFNSFANPYH